MGLIFCFVMLVPIVMVSDLKIESFKIEAENIGESRNVHLHCVVDAVEDIKEVNIELYRIYASSKTKLSKHVGRKRVIYTINNVSCEDLGVYECQGYQNGIRQKTWSQKLLDVPCLQKFAKENNVERNILIEEGRMVQLKLTVISNPLSSVTWHRSYNQTDMFQVTNDSSHMIYSRTHRFEPFKMTYLLDTSDTKNIIYVATSQQPQYGSVKPFVFHLRTKGTTDEEVGSTEFKTVKCNPVLATGWIVSALLFLALMFVGLALTIMKRKGKSLRESLFYPVT